MLFIPSFNFDDYKEGLPDHHLVSQCIPPRDFLDFQFSDPGPYAFITADDTGKLQQHFVVRQDIAEALKHLEADFGISIKNPVLRNYPEHLALHMGMQPQITETKKGIIYTFPLPEHVQLKPGVLEKIRLGNSNATGTGAYTKESGQWLKKMRLMENNFHAALFSDLMMDIPKQLPPMPLHEVLQKSKPFRVENITKLQEYFLKHPAALSELEQKLIDAHIEPKFQLAGNGRNGVFLKAGDVVISIRGDIFNENLKNSTFGKGKPLRQPLPQHLHNLAYFESGPLNIEITPSQILKNMPVSELDNMVEAIAHTPHPVRGRQWHFNDPEIRNVGFSPQGTMYVLDGNAIGEASNVFGFKPKTKIPTDWLNADGTWKQYTEFQELHERFNSTLHQAGGRLGPTYEELEQAAAHSKAKWIIGGIVLTGISIAGVVAAIQHKKSHIDTVSDRRKAAAQANRPITPL